MLDKPERRPGDVILNQYIPQATKELREEARENLRRLAHLIIRVHARQTGDNPPFETRANRERALDSESHPPIV